MPYMEYKSDGKAEQFIKSIKTAGVDVEGEKAVVERLSEIPNWHSAFTTLAKNGKIIGIQFLPKDGKTPNFDKIREIMDTFGFNKKQEQLFETCLGA